QHELVHVDLRGSRLCRELACEHAHRRSYAPSHSQPPLPPRRRNTTRAPSCSTSNSLAPALPGGLPLLAGRAPLLAGRAPLLARIVGSVPPSLTNSARQVDCRPAVQEPAYLGLAIPAVTARRPDRGEFAGPSPARHGLRIDSKHGRDLGRREEPIVRL